MPALLKLHRTEVTQSRVQSSMIVEGHPVQHRIHGFLSGSEFLAVQTGRLQTPPEAFRGGVDAPMSSRSCGIFQVSQDKRVQLADDIALEAAVDFLF